MAIEKLFAVRGATTIEENSERQIAERTAELIEKIVRDNKIYENSRQPVSCIISSTKDITEIYPAKAVRESGLLRCPVFSCLEPPIKDALPLCIRVMIECADYSVGGAEAKYVYLHSAKTLRPDLFSAFSVAVDGPSGAGKSTISKLLAERLNMTYLDTGAMYRAIGLKMHREGVDVNDVKNIERVLGQTAIDVSYKNSVQQVLLDGEDVGEEIRRHYVSKLASDFSAVPAVRIKLVDIQRDIAAQKDCILDGRDIGTYVLPDASVKFFLTASVKERAARRYKELLQKGEKRTLAEVESDIVQRDYNDANRSFAPLKKADDAIEINSDGMDIEQVVSVMKQIIEEKR